MLALLIFAQPENLLCVSPDINAVDDVKIADFGESIKLPEDEMAIGIRGSPSYIGKDSRYSCHFYLSNCSPVKSSFLLAPEIWMDEPYGPKADMWSLGVVTFILSAQFNSA